MIKSMARNLDALIELYMENFEHEVAQHFSDFDYEKSEDEFAGPFYLSEISRRMFISYVSGIRSKEIDCAMENEGA